MHIAFLSPEYSHDNKPDGGLANYLRKVGLELTGRGHKVSVFCLSSIDKFWIDHGVNVFEVQRFVYPYQLKRINGLASVLPVLAQINSAQRLEKAFWKVNQSSPVDIIQASSYRSPGYTLLKNRRIPVVCRISSYAPLIRSAEGRQRDFVEYMRDWLEIRQVLDAQAAFAPSQLMSDTYARLEGCRPRVIRTPFETVEIPMDDSCYKSKFGGKHYLLYFGTLKLVKGVDLLADVITPVLKKHPDLLFVFVGRDDRLNNGKKIFEYILERNKLFEDRLLYHPALPKASLYPIVANALGVLMPSRVDNYPNACLEALSLSVPVIGTYQSSLDEMIVDGKTGFLAPNGDPESYHAAIERLLSLTPGQKVQMKADIEYSVRSRLVEDRIGQLIQFYQENIEAFRLGGNTQ